MMKWLFAIIGIAFSISASGANYVTKAYNESRGQMLLSISERHCDNSASNADSSNIIANNDILTLYENRTGTSPVLNNDYGFDKNNVVVSISKQPTNGTAIIRENKVLEYTPRYLFVGIDVVTYKICNPKGDCAEAKLVIEVLDYDYKPQCVDDHVDLLRDTETEIAFLNNDLELDDPPLTIEIISDITNGSSRLNSNNSITPLFDRFFLGQDSILYQVCDANGDCSMATIYVAVVVDNSLKIYMPNGISPNGDGLNDTFVIPDLSTYTEMELTVMDRWGNLVYQNLEYNNNWDGIANKGNFNGQILPNGAYYYLLKVDGLSKNLTGFIYISK